jgi:hypothetical protein
MKTEPTTPLPAIPPLSSSDLFGLLLTALVMWTLLHYTDKWRKEDISEYERMCAAGDQPTYTVMGIPVNWTPYDE